MAGKKDKSVVAVISGLTDSQAARISADIMKSKQRNAPNGRGTVASGFTSSVGSLLQKGTKRIGGRGVGLACTRKRARFSRS